MSELWLPVLLSSLACLAISAIVWGVLPLHVREHRRLPAEPELLDALRRQMPAPGIYSFPYSGTCGVSATRADVVANLQRGPVGFLVIGRTGARRALVPLAQYFVFFAIVAMLTAYVASIAGLKDGAPFLRVFRLVAIVSSMALTLGSAPLSIWFSRPWKSWLLHCADGLACGLAMGTVFGWLWPA
jgi:hypothetical protein